MSTHFRLLLIVVIVFVAGGAVLVLMSTDDRPHSVPDPVQASVSEQPEKTVEPPRQNAGDIARSPMITAPQSAPAMPPRHVSPAAVPQLTPPAPIESPRSPAVAIPGHLQGEDAFVTDRMVDVRSLGALLKGEDFNRVMDELSGQALQSPLARDLTALYSASALQASAANDGVTVRAMACGLKLCLASVTAPTAEAMTPWRKSLMSSQDAPTYTVGSYDKPMPDGSIEHRLVFSIDPAIRGSGVRPGG